jgi:hypothetical protein
MPVVTTNRGTFRWRWANRVVLVEAVVLLIVTAALQKWVPMPRWAAVLGRPATVPEPWNGRQVETLLAASANPREARVARAVARATRLLPREPSCLAQAATAQLLLRQRRSAGVVVVGLKPPVAGDGSPGKWSAHAWLLGGRGALTGGPAAAGFTATTVFEVPGRLTAERVDLTGGSVAG